MASEGMKNSKIPTTQQTGKAVKFKNADTYVGQAGLPHNKKHSKNYDPDVTVQKR